MAITVNTFALPEQTSGVYRATITDESGGMLPGSTLTSLSLYVYVVNTGGTLTYINGRNHQDVLNTNGVQVFDSLQSDTLTDGTTVPYNLKWTIDPGDTTIQNPALQVERHCALFFWTWGVGKSGAHEVVLSVKNIVGI